MEERQASIHLPAHAHTAAAGGDADRGYIGVGGPGGDGAVSDAGAAARAAKQLSLSPRSPRIPVSVTVSSQAREPDIAEDDDMVVSRLVVCTLFSLASTASTAITAITARLWR